MYLMHNPGQKFYYMSKQGKADVLIFKNFDSMKSVESSCEYGHVHDGKHLGGLEVLMALVAPHASFLHPDATTQTKARESIEVRAFVFTNPE